MNKHPRALYLSCFLIAGLWAGSVVSFLVSQKGTSPMTAEVVTQSLDGTFAARPHLLGRGNDTPRTTPYSEDTAPAFDFPAPKLPSVPDLIDKLTPDQPEEPKADSMPDQVTGVMAALSRLLHGEGGFADIMTLVIFGLTIYGGWNMGSSDMLFKLILGLFSKKGNYAPILQSALDRSPDSRIRRRRRRN